MGTMDTKRGREQAQDRDLRDLTARVDAWEQEERRVHGAIENGLATIDRKAETAEIGVARIEGRQAQNRWVVGIAITVALFLLGGIWQNQRDAAQTAAEALTKIEAWIPEATRWGKNLDKGVEEAKAVSKERHEKQQKQLDKIDERLDKIERRQRRQGE